MLIWLDFVSLSFGLALPGFVSSEIAVSTPCPWIHSASLALVLGSVGWELAGSAAAAPAWRRALWDVFMASHWYHFSH